MQILNAADKKFTVIPVKTGIHAYVASGAYRLTRAASPMDPDFRRDDDGVSVSL